MTKLKAQQILGVRVIPDEMGEYIALALLLVHERAKGASSFWAPYIDVLPDIDEVGPSYAWYIHISESISIGLSIDQSIWIYLCECVCMYIYMYIYIYR